VECPRAVSTYTRSYTQKAFFGPPSEALVTPFSTQKPVKNHYCRSTIQEPIFSVSNAEFEGGDDGHGHGDCTFLVKQAQPSHRAENLLEVVRKVCCALGVDSVVSNSSRTGCGRGTRAHDRGQRAVFHLFSSLPAPFPAADKVGEGKMFPSAPLCVTLPREINTGETGAFLPSSCAGGGREALPPTPMALGFMPLANRACQHECEDVHVQDRHASVSLCDLARRQSVVHLPVRAQAQARVHEGKRGTWKGDSEGGGQLVFIQPLAL
jgi:hypothetical protein